MEVNVKDEIIKTKKTLNSSRKLRPNEKYQLIKKLTELEEVWENGFDNENIINLNKDIKDILKNDFCYHKLYRRIDKCYE